LKMNRRKKRIKEATATLSKASTSPGAVSELETALYKVEYAHAEAVIRGKFPDKEGEE
jgi:hypothetical protein